MKKQIDSFTQISEQYANKVGQSHIRSFSKVALGVSFLLIIATNPAAAAQGNNSTVNICANNNTLVGIANAVIQLSIYGGLAGVFVTYFMTTFAETLPIGQESMQKIRDHRTNAMKGAVKLLAVGPIGYIIIQFADLPFASCINLIPF